jgi:hypothetical protein
VRAYNIFNTEIAELITSWTMKCVRLHSRNFSISGLSIWEFILDNEISRIGSHISSIYMLCTDLDKM